MDVQAKRVELIEWILNLKEEALDKLNEMKEVTFSNEDDFEDKYIERELSPMTVEELNKRIDKSEDDFKNGRFTSSETLLSKYI